MWVFYHTPSAVDPAIESSGAYALMSLAVACISWWAFIKILAKSK